MRSDEKREAAQAATKNPTRSHAWAKPPNPAALESYLGELPQTVFFDSPDFYFPVERLMPRHADISSRDFPSLADFVASAQIPRRRLKICMIVFEFAGPSAPSGAALWQRRMAEGLRDIGHEVTVLFLPGEYCDNGPIYKWSDYFADENIRLVPLPPLEIPVPNDPVSSALRRPRAIYEWLKDKSFDLVHAPAAKGCAFCALSAKRLGLAFDETQFMVRASPPTMWGLLADAKPVSSLRLLAVAHAERKSVELADAIIGSSQYMLRWMLRHGYDLPRDRCFVQADVLPDADPNAEHVRETARIDEIVFVDSFDSPSVAGIYKRSLEMLEETVRGIAVSYLVIGPNEQFLSNTRDRAPTERVVQTANIFEAIAYLRRKRRLAVMLSTADRNLHLLAECLAQHIPLLTSNQGGGQELIAEADRTLATCAGTPAALVEKIRAAAGGSVPLPRLAFDVGQNFDAWLKSHSALATARAIYSTWNGIAGAEGNPAHDPLVSICITHFNRPAQLAQAIESVRQQTYKKIEIVVVDDGSISRDAKLYLARLDAELASAKSGRVVRQENRYLGAARNLGIKSSIGDYVLLMDDDNLMKPHAVETFMRAAMRSGSDILCCYSDTFRGAGLPGQIDRNHERITPLGDSISLGLFCNCFGDSNCMVHRRVFDALGGFTEDYGIGLDDHEFFLRAVLRGFKLMVIPEALYWYRLSEVRLRHYHLDAFAGRLRVLNAFLDNVPLSLYEALWFAQGSFSSKSEPRSARGWSLRAALRSISNRRDAALIYASGLFDVDYYLRTNPDVAKTNRSPLLHFVRYGAREGRNPSPTFDLASYLDDRPYLAESLVNPLLHFIRSSRQDMTIAAAIRRLLLERLGLRGERHDEQGSYLRR